jgi:hypothetical protein
MTHPEGLDRREYWILAVAIRSWIPVAVLAEPNRAEIFNLPGPSFTPIELLETLDRLFQRGDLVAQQEHERDNGQNAFTPARHEVEAALANEIKLYYRLTTQGGARWEAAVRPRWNLFICARCDSETRQCVATASERQLVEQYLAARPYQSIGGSRIKGTESWEVLRPWQATYWKTLAVGHQVRYRVESGGNEEYKPSPAWVKEFTLDTSFWNRPIGELELMKQRRQQARHRIEMPNESES